MVTKLRGKFFRVDHPSAGRQIGYPGVGKFWRFSTEVAVYRGNGTSRQAHDYYG